MTLQFTGEQQNVIRAEQKSLLVSAAAGSGKTAVLTERIVERIQNGQLDVRQVLVVTFTEAAARQMRTKIEEKLRAARADSRDPEKRRDLSRQLTLLPTAAISTIHAFCLQVIRNFYHLLTDQQGRPLIEPGFTVQDPFESDQLLRDVLDEWLNQQYEAIDNGGEPGDPDWPAAVRAFYRLMDGYGDSRSDQPVRELLLRVYRFLRSLPDYRVFADQKRQALAEAAADFAHSPYCRTLLDQLRLRLDRAMTALPDLQALLSGPIRFLADNRRHEAVKSQLSSALQILSGLHLYLHQGGCDWDEIRSRVQPLADLKLPRASARDPEDKTAFLELFAGFVAETICFLTGNFATERFRRHFLFQTRYVFNQSVAQIEQETREMLPVIDRFIVLLAGLDERYAEQKRRAALVDFSDFEHAALAILRQEEANGYYRERFCEIYVDEYQDTSSIQEAILQTISQNNCLMVGDIKQSIYRFRHARPQIFRQKAELFGRNDGGQLLRLNRNFRSVSGILAAVNDVFVQLMSEGAGEIDYDQGQALVPVRPDPLRQAVEILLLDRHDAASADDTDEEQDPADTAGRPDLADLNRYGLEALAIASRLRSLSEQGLKWSDMVILTRTRAIMAVCREQLEAAGIPAAADTGSAALDQPVIRLLESMIHVLDNWRQDIHLAAVLHGGIGRESFSIEDLARIRLLGKTQGLRFFHEAVFAYQLEGPDESLKIRLSSFLGWLAELRGKEQILTVGELVGLICTGTGWIDRVAAQPGGREQVRVLRQFQSWAEDFEKNRQKGLFRFARYLERMREQDLFEAPIGQTPADENAVRIMTIHGSKGLEFPVVFLAGISGRITGSDSQEHILFSENLGIGFDYADPKRRIRYPTHLKIAMLDEIRAAGMAEELRLLYVAMTRAMDRLYLVGTVHIDPENGDRRLCSLIDQARRYTARQLPDHLVRSARSFLEWLVLVLARNPAVDLSFLAGENTCRGAAQIKKTAAEPEQTEQTEQVTPGLFEPYPAWSVTLLRSAAITAADGAVRAETTGAVEPASPCLAIPATHGETPPPEEQDRLRRLVIEPYRFARAARTPVKLTVSELKSRAPAEDPDADQPAFPAAEQMGWRGIDLSLRLADETGDRPDQPGARLAGAQLGTALHTVFRYLDLPTARRDNRPDAIERQIEAMRREAMLTEAEADAVLPFAGAIRRYVVSDLAGELAEAMEKGGTVYQELPFTLALPACQVYDPCDGLAADDQVMVQGIIDCWYRDASGMTLIDYKSDWIKGSQDDLITEIRRRYTNQMAWYVRAIETLTGQRVHRCLIWHIRRGLAIPIDTEPL